MEELAEIPSCNLAETIHAKWRKSSGVVVDLYDATVDDYIRAFLQITAYRDYRLGGDVGQGPSQEELQLRVAQRLATRRRDPAHLQRAVEKLAVAEEICTRSPHYEGAEVFGSQKRKADQLIGDDDESHRPDLVNFSRPRATQRITRSRAARLSTITEDSSPCPPDVSPPTTQQISSPRRTARGIRRVNSVQESSVNPRHWHITRVPYTSHKRCMANSKVTTKKCLALIVKNNKSTPAPCYNGHFFTKKLNRSHEHEFLFCGDDINRCVMGAIRMGTMRFSQFEARPPIPPIWPVAIGTNLSRKEIFILENAGFQFAEKEGITPTRLFNNLPPPADLSGYPVPDSPDVWESSRKCKTYKRHLKKATLDQQMQVAKAESIRGGIDKISMLPPPTLAATITLKSRPDDEDSVYSLSINTIPYCTCPAFKEMYTKLERTKNPYMHCKHIYFVLVVVAMFDPEKDLFIHYQTWTWNEVKRILERVLAAHEAS